MAAQGAPISRPRWSWVKHVADDSTDQYTSPPIPVLEIAERSGVDVVFTDFGDFNDAVAGFCDFGTKKIHVNVNDASNRQTFTIAHELGHWLLHRDYYVQNPEKYPVLPRFEKPDNNDPLEKEANHFAANLLVPERLLKPVITAPVAYLATVFGVSRSMMEYRVKNVK